MAPMEKPDVRHDVGVGFGIVCLQSPRDRVHLRARALQGRPRLEPPDHERRVAKKSPETMRTGIFSTTSAVFNVPPSIW
jgi:hypothetical protein